MPLNGGKCLQPGTCAHTRPSLFQFAKFEENRAGDEKDDRIGNQHRTKSASPMSTHLEVFGLEQRRRSRAPQKAVEAINNVPLQRLTRQGPNHVPIVQGAVSQHGDKVAPSRIPRHAREARVLALGHARGRTTAQRVKLEHTCAVKRQGANNNRVGPWVSTS